MDYMLLLSVFISFLGCLIILPMWIKKARSLDMTWEDMNKVGHPKNVASSGGIIVLCSFFCGILVYLFVKTFVSGRSLHEAEIFALLTTLLFLGVVGLTDDLLGWKKGGLNTKVRIALSILASVPLVVLNVGNHVINLPFLGMVNLGILYPLIIMPLAIGFVSTTYNFLAGFNGLEAGMGILILGFFSFVSYYTGSPWLCIIGLCMCAALAGFWIFNKTPAQVFPGDILTYSVGALIVSMAILGNFEKILLIVYIPYFIEVILKMRGKLHKHSFGKVNPDGSLSMPYDKIYGLTHFSIWFLSKFKKKVRENDVVYFIYFIEIIFIIIASIFLFIK